MKQTIQEALSWRYATKEFDTTKKVATEDLQTVIDAGRFAPTAYGLQPFKLIHITSDTLRNTIRAEAALNQPQVTDGSDFFVVAYRTDIDEAFVDSYVKRISDTRDLPVESLSDFSAMMKGDIVGRDENGRHLWASRQAYIALGMMLETAALLKIDACPMEGFNPDSLDTILGLKEKNLRSLGLVAFGYRKDSDIYATLKKVRLSEEEFVITA